MTGEGSGVAGDEERRSAATRVPPPLSASPSPSRRAESGPGTGTSAPGPSTATPPWTTSSASSRLQHAGFRGAGARVHPDDQPGFGKHSAGRPCRALPPSLGRAPHRPPRREVRWLEAKAHLSYGADGAPTELVGVAVDVTERHASQQASAAASRARELATERVGAVERRIALLARAADLLDAPLDLDAALQEVANLAIDVLADWCTVDLLTEGQQIHRAAVAHRDPAMVARAQELQRKYPQDTNDPAFRHLLASREPIFVEHFDDDMLTALAKDLGAARGGARVPHQLLPRGPLSGRRRGIGTISLTRPWMPPSTRRTSSSPSTWDGGPAPLSRRPASTPSCARPHRCSRRAYAWPPFPKSPARPCRRTTVRAPRGCRSVVTSTTSSAPDLTAGGWPWATSAARPGRGGTHGSVRYFSRAVAPDTTPAWSRSAQRRAPRPGGGGQLTTWVLATFRAAPGQGASAAATPIVLSVASAGHPAPLHFSPGRGVSAVPVTGTVVGLLPEIDVARVDVTLDPGESLLLHRRRHRGAHLDGLLVGEERLSALFEAHHDGPADCRALTGWPRRSST